MENPGGDSRLIIADLEVRSVPRSFARITSVSANSVRIDNTHQSATLEIVGSEGLRPLRPTKSETVPIPTRLMFPNDFSLEIEFPPPPQKPNSLMGELYGRTMVRLPTEELRPQVEVFRQEGQGYKSIDLRALETLSRSSQLRSKQQLESSGALHAEIFLDWLDRAMIAMQRTVTSPDFYKGIAEAATHILGFDRAEVILWDGTDWYRDPAYTYIAESMDAKSVKPPSKTMLMDALSRKAIVVYPEVQQKALTDDADSLRGLIQAVACPILDENGEGLGVFYGDRAPHSTGEFNAVSNVEEKLIEILTTSIAAGIARAKREELVTKYQQFFSPKVTDAIRKNPKLLEGEDCDVTVLFCDIRGFSRITDQIGTAKAMRWVQDTLSELSVHVLDSDGVLVDYVGDEMFGMWGAPEKSPDHAFRAATAATNMMKLSKVLSNRWRSVIPGGVDFGIGLSTGRARVGNTGSTQKFKYGPMGRVVNLGSRIQGLTKQWKVATLLDGATEQLLPPDMLRRRICKARVVGLDGDIDLYELLRNDDDEKNLLKLEYERALDLFEAGNHRMASKAFSELAQKFPQDGPSLMMLVRAVKELAEPSEKFNPVWCATNK